MDPEVSSIVGSSGQAVAAPNLPAQLTRVLQVLKDEELKALVKAQEGDLEHHVPWNQPRAAQVDAIVTGLSSRGLLTAPFFAALAGYVFESKQQLEDVARLAYGYGLTATPFSFPHVRAKFAQDAAPIYQAPEFNAYERGALSPATRDPVEWIAERFNATANGLTGARRVAICGRVGAGRTRLAMEYEHRYHSRYASTLRLRCAGGIVQATLDLRTFLKEHGAPAVLPSDIDQLDFATLEIRLRTIASRAQRRYLLIYDDYDVAASSANVERYRDDSNLTESAPPPIIDDGPFDLLFVRATPGEEDLSVIVVDKINTEAATEILLIGSDPTNGWSTRARSLAKRAAEAMHGKAAALALASSLLAWAEDYEDPVQTLERLANMSPGQPNRLLMEAFNPSGAPSSPWNPEAIGAVAPLIEEIRRRLSAAERKVLQSLAYVAPEQPVDLDLLQEIVEALPSDPRARQLEGKTVRIATRMLKRSGLVRRTEDGPPEISALVQAGVLYLSARAPDGLTDLAKQEAAVLDCLASKPWPELDDEWRSSRALSEERGAREAKVIHLVAVVERLATWKHPHPMRLALPHQELILRVIRYLRWEGDYERGDQIAAEVQRSEVLDPAVVRRLHLERGLLALRRRHQRKELQDLALAELNAACSDSRPRGAKRQLITWVRARAEVAQISLARDEVKLLHTWGAADAPGSAPGFAKLYADAAESLQQMIAWLPKDDKGGEAWVVRALLHRRRSELIRKQSEWEPSNPALRLEAASALDASMSCFPVAPASGAAAGSPTREDYADWQHARYLRALRLLEAHAPESESFASALLMLNEAYNAHRRKLSARHPDVCAMRLALSKWRAIGGDFEEALNLAKENETLVKQDPTSNPVDVAQVLAMHGFVLLWRAYQRVTSASRAAPKGAREDLGDARAALRQALGERRLEGDGLKLRRLRAQIAADAAFVDAIEDMLANAGSTSRRDLVRASVAKMRSVWPPASEQLLRRERMLERLDDLYARARP